MCAKSISSPFSISFIESTLSHSITASCIIVHFNVGKVEVCAFDDESVLISVSGVQKDEKIDWPYHHSSCHLYININNSSSSSNKKTKHLILSCAFSLVPPPPPPAAAAALAVANVTSYIVCCARFACHKNSVFHQQLNLPYTR